MHTTKITSGTSDSAAISVNGVDLVGISIPTITSAAITFRVSYDGGTTFLGMFTVAGELSLSAGTGLVYLALDPNLFKGVEVLKIRSGTNASAVNQGADRVITLHFAEKR